MNCVREDAVAASWYRYSGESWPEGISISSPSSDVGFHSSNMVFKWRVSSFMIDLGLSNKISESIEPVSSLRTIKAACMISSPLLLVEFDEVSMPP